MLRTATRGRAQPPSTVARVALLAALVFAAPSPASSDEPADFQFAAPRFSFGVRGGYAINRADSDVFEFFEENLTLERSDFDAPVLAVDFSWHVLSWLDAMIGLEVSGSSSSSEYRDFVDEDDFPIEQRTRLTQIPLTVSAKAYPFGRGKQVGQFAWIPKAVAPYVGAGFGGTWYELKQSGDFVDFTDLSIFEGVFRSEGWAFAGHAFVGVDVKVTRSLGVVVEGRYYWASADLSGNFVGFDAIDLDGGRIMAGINWKL